MTLTFLAVFFTREDLLHCTCPTREMDVIYVANMCTCVGSIVARALSSCQ